MRDFVVFSLGCKVNQYEGRALIDKLHNLGYDAVDSLEKARYYIINTCSVTNEADRKSRQMISRVLKLNNEAKIYVTGCSSQNESGVFLQKDNVKIVSGTGGKMRFLDDVLEDIKNGTEKKKNIYDLPENYEDDLTPQLTHTRGNIKIQDGCNSYCSYCIIPFLRGKSRSRPIDSIVEQARTLSQTTKEIVLTGINISSFNSQDGNLIELIKRLKDVKVRKRLGSLECSIISEQFIEAMEDSGFCDHFHLSLQSGSDSVLKRMNRRYTSNEFIEKVQLIRKYHPHGGITTDIITGFPEETEQEFNETIATVNEIKFSDAHIFPYSERKGTKAYNLNQLDKKIREDRAKILKSIANEHKEEFLRSQTNRILDVYIEENKGEYSTGYTSNYIKVYSKADSQSLKKHIIKEIYQDGVKGEIYE